MTNIVNSITLRIILIIKRLELSLKVKISWHNCSNKKGLCFVIFLHLLHHKKLAHHAPDKVTGAYFH